MVMGDATGVCNNTLANASPSTCWMQQWWMLKKKGVTKPDPMTQFLMNLNKLLDKLQDKEHEIVLPLDSNEDTNVEGPFNKFIMDNDLVDAYKHMHLNLHPPTYLRGNKRLDYILITPSLISALTAIKYLPFHTRFFSDHCTLWADFDFLEILVVQ
eukprot:11016054-Ditylum_brightwellii.AAC.1